MKKCFCFAALLGLILLAMPQGAKAQKVEYRQSQSRLIEPQQQVFVRPLVVDLQVTTNERQKADWEFPDADVTKMTGQDMDNLKIRALYQTAELLDADVIVAPTFDIRTLKKGIRITVIGFPAKYQNWKVATEEKDYKWIQDVYGVNIRSVNPYQSLGDNNAKNSDKEK